MMRSALLTTILVILPAGLGLSPALAKDTINLPLPGDPRPPGQQLQEAANDSANAGKIIHLAPGIYKLDPSVGPPSLGGRLTLQPGMDILGENDYVDCDGDGVWDPVSCSGGTVGPNDQFVVTGSETVIDGRLVVSLADDGPQGLIRAGRNNSISHVTILGPNSPNVFGGVIINLHANGLITAVVTDTLIHGGARGIYCQNPFPVAGTVAQVTLKRNIIRNITVGGTPRFAIQFLNPNTNGNIWVGTVQYNRVYNSGVGMFLTGNQSAFAQTTVFSFRNLFEFNRLGIAVQAGQDGGGQIQPPRGGTHNTFALFSQEDVVRKNDGTTAGLVDFGDSRFGGGVALMAGANSSPRSGVPQITSSSGNRLAAQFLNTRIEDNHYGNVIDAPVRNLEVLGYWANPARTEFGTDNQSIVTVRLPCDVAQAGFLRDDSDPDQIAGLPNSAFLVFEPCVPQP